MGNKISSDEPRRNTYKSLANDPAGYTSFHNTSELENELESNLEIQQSTKSREAARRNEETVAQTGLVSHVHSGYAMEINQLPFPTLICDTGYTILAANTSFQEFTGLANSAYAGKNFSEFIQLSDTNEELPQVEEFLRTGKNTLDVELTLNTSNKSLKNVLLKSQLIKDASGTPEQIVIQLVDITKKIHAAEQLRKKSDELERFVYSTSHDLRAPLRSILGLVYIIQQETNQDTIKTYLDMIRSSVNRMDNFIKEIVDLSRNSRQPLNKEEIDLKEIVTEIFDSLRFIPGAEKIDFILNIKQSKPFVSDISRIKVVLNNLISNAIAYHRMEQEHPIIEVRINVTNKYCYIEVIDNGRGIQKEHQAKIFDMFYRASDDTKGSGLGLYIVKEAVQKLNGEIRIKSTWGEGTTFNLKFFNHAL